VKQPEPPKRNRSVHDIELMAQAEAKRARKRRKRLARIRHKKPR
jgi:hypothetical protein